MRTGASSPRGEPPHALYLGLDLSTQQLKAVVHDSDGQLVHTHAVNFDKDLSQFGTTEGAIHDADGLRVTAPVELWLAAVDVAIDNLKQHIAVNEIRGISGCAQQHGTVYWSRIGVTSLENLSSGESFQQGLKDGFVRNQSPIWMDSSTGAQCERIEKAVGGAEALAEMTGSKAYHRFSGPQIAKMIDEEHDLYVATERISLVSSFACSLFLGRVAPIEYNDATGMNLLDIRTRKWHDTCMRAVLTDTSTEAAEVQDMERKLGTPTHASTILGTVSEYMVTRHGFSPECIVLPFVGDNAGALSGCCPSATDVVVSLGTSDTVLFSSATKANTDAHMLAHPIEKDANMALVCFKNGSLTRERVRRALRLEWMQLDELIARSPAGNDGNIGFYFDLPEIAPNVPAGDHRFNSQDEPVQHFDDVQEARAVMEQQCLWKRFYAEKMGSALGQGRLLLTGGAAKNASIQQILADVFNMPVYLVKGESAAAGGAMRARHANLCVDCARVSKCFLEMCKGSVSSELVATPRKECHQVYTNMMKKVRYHEESMTK